MGRPLVLAVVGASPSARARSREHRRSRPQAVASRNTSCLRASRRSKCPRSAVPATPDARATRRMNPPAGGREGDRAAHGETRPETVCRLRWWRRRRQRSQWLREGGRRRGDARDLREEPGGNALKSLHRVFWWPGGGGGGGGGEGEEETRAAAVRVHTPVLCWPRRRGWKLRKLGAGRQTGSQEPTRSNRRRWR